VYVPLTHEVNPTILVKVPTNYNVKRCTIMTTPTFTMIENVLLYTQHIFQLQFMSIRSS